jgi:NAD(P)-dependent dehydrogenase (short-subunit alcohol dehydrogenase family)
MAVAIVTGGSRGIGAAAAVRLAADGWSVCLSYRTEAARAAEVVRSCTELGVDAVAVPADMADEGSIQALVATALGLGPLGALVNNAGIVDVVARVEDFDRSRLQRMFTVNVVGPILCAREAVRAMSSRHGGTGGSIVNVSSAASRIGSPGQYVDYAASKGAIDTFTLGLAKEVAQEGIRVNAVRPGVIDTEIHASGGQPTKAADAAAAIPLGRPGRAEEIAESIAWLCSDAASYVTGAILDVSGGR